MIIQFLALVRQDMNLFFTDWRAGRGLLVPIICGSFFGYLFGGHKGSVETSKVPVLVMDQDESEISRALVKQLTAEKNLEIKPSTPVAAREAVRKGKAIAAIIIPKDFGEDAGRALLLR
jgi:ABC-2 type transport system permease protein